MMNPTYKIWLKGQGLYTLLLLCSFTIYFIYEKGITSFVLSDLFSVLTIVLLIMLVESIFSLPVIIVLASLLASLKVLKQDIYVVMGLSVVVTSASLYICAYLMAYILFQEDFSSINSEILFHVLTAGIVISIGITIQINRRKIHQYIQPHNDNKTNN